MSADRERLYIHAINRDLTRARQIVVDLREVATGDVAGTAYRLVAEPNTKDGHDAVEACPTIQSQPVGATGGMVRYRLGPRSVTILEFDR